jgi:hypothetical protein
MTEPSIVVAGGLPLPSSVGPGMSTVTEYDITSRSTTAGLIAVRNPERETVPDETEPVLAWLASAEARQYVNHWVALDPDSGDFRGLADDLPELRLWQSRNATIIFVDPPPENWLDA